MNIRQKVYDWKERLQDRHMLSIIVVLIAIIAILGLYTYKKQTQYRQASENEYNLAFYQLIGYVSNVEMYLAKSMVSKNSEHGAETLTYVWREANLAQAYLARLPIESSNLENTAKFLNQVSEYSYSLSRKTINNEDLSDEDLENLKKLHSYSVELSNTLIQLAEDINQEKISWGELTKKGSVVFAQQVSNMSKDSFGSVEENFHEFEGLIYDGAFSEHLTNPERKGLTGEDITAEQAKEKVIEFISSERAKEVLSSNFVENANIPSYNFTIELNDGNTCAISVSKKGGHIVYMNINRNVEAEVITQEQANSVGKEFLKQKGFEQMKPTYYLKQNGVVTINYAYNQDDVVIYSDLIKVKIALDNGEILGIETTGYLNSHTERDLSEIKVSIDEARKNLNSDLEILSEGLAVIPTEYSTEIFCWEFKGKVEDREFLVYINVETGKQEDVLVILNTPNGTLTL